MKNLTLIISSFLIFLLLVPVVQARITPEDIINAKKSAYGDKVKSYSPLNKQKLETLSQKIAELNKIKTEELSQIMGRQGEVLDEYQRRKGGDSTPAIEKARYWLTFAHEAVAYQAAKIYIFDLAHENNLKQDALKTLNLFKYELNYARSTAVKSQKIIADLARGQ